jgi:MoCo/4Fe-4S cofactor protein with predicted Tat translocation signal
MKQNKNEVWVGVEQLNNDPALTDLNKQEFVELPIVDQLSEEKTLGQETSRRDFLKYLGFGLGAATIAAGCDIPVKRAIPYVVKPDEIVPGVATYYASSFVQGGDYCSVLVKTREGRPIKIEGNSLSPITGGGTSARVQASVLDLYDIARFQHPLKMESGKMKKVSWEDLDQAVKGALTGNAQVRIVTNTVLSPTAKKAFEDFGAAYPNAKVVTYDPVSSSAMLEANEADFGQKAVPDYHFDKAEVIVSFGADFLGTWVSPVEFAQQYAKNRKIDDLEHPKMSHHIQVESFMSMTGSNADNRIVIKPSEQGAAIATLYNELAATNGFPSVSAPAINEKAAAAIKKMVSVLNKHKSKSLVVAGSNNVGEQTLVNAINDMLNNYGETIDFTHASMQRQGVDKNVQDLINEMNGGSVDAVFFMGGANPAYDLPNAQAFADALAKVKTKVSFAMLPDDTTALCDYVAPAPHYLESWGDVEPKRGHYGLVQPTIHPLFATRQAEESLLRWAESANLNITAEQPYYEYLSAHWQEAIFPQQNNFATFQAFWDSVLHDGVFAADVPAVQVVFGGDVTGAAAKINKPASGEFEVSFFEAVNIGSGQYAGNPWLQEMPDPVTRTTWDNHLAIPVGWDGGNSFQGFKGLNDRELYGEADKVQLTVNGGTEEFTCVRQFGLKENTMAVALGYGRKKITQTGRNVGVNVYPWLGIDANGNTMYYASDVQVSEKSGHEPLFACVQYHHTMGVTGTDPETNEEINVDEKTVMSLGEGYQGGLTNRTVIFQDNIRNMGTPAHDDHGHDDHGGEEDHGGDNGHDDSLLGRIRHKREEAAHLNSETLYPFDEYTEKFYSQGHHWAMHVDLNACIGCGACSVACTAENNIPVVGKTEVARHHEMAWLRIDRYYFGDYENPNVVYQPMMCQHCDNAPCENVCPVAATNHSAEGLNQMTYNRCIGTRYCANNCPYKVRRFNWLDYTAADIFPANEPVVNGEAIPYGADNLTRMVLNPDVTVRSRGVIEKCSFCVQRIQEGKLTAKRESRRLNDGDVKSACQTACPTGAITFGDLNNEDSAVAKKVKSQLNYRVLEEVNTQSSVYYSAKVVNRDEEIS